MNKNTIHSISYEKDQCILEIVLNEMKEKLNENEKRVIFDLKGCKVQYFYKQFLLDIKTKRIKKIPKNEQILAKEIVKLKKKFDYFCCVQAYQTIEERIEKQLEATILKRKEKAKRKREKRMKIKNDKRTSLRPSLGKPTHVIVSDASSYPEKKRSKISGVIYGSKQKIISEYSKEVEYTNNTAYLEIMAFERMVNLAKLDQLESVLFKVDNQPLYKAFLKERTTGKRKRSIFREIHNCFDVYPEWNLMYVNRKEVSAAHRLCKL